MGLRTSVKGYLIAQRLNLATDPLSENETISNNVTAPLDPPSLSVEEMTMDSGTYGLGICGGNIPCFPMLNSAKSMASYMTRTRAESPPPQGGNLNSNTPSVSVPSSPQTEGEILQSFNLKSFHYNELKTATCNFRSDRLLGDDGFGSAYKGWIDEHSFAAAKPGTGMAVAITRLNQQRTLRSHEECMTQVKYFGQLVHPNIVKLIGYCREDDRQLLVYECMPNGSLERHLSGAQPLSWILLMKIAVGAAKGLAFLHSNEAHVIYGDFNSSKILLDLNYNAKLYGYGYRHAAHDFQLYEAPWHGPPGLEYVAPELISFFHEDPDDGHLTPKSDVYSFGIVMLEMLSGRRALDKNRPAGEQNLAEWAKPYLANKRRVRQILDPRMEGQFSVANARKAVDLAFQCLSRDPELRPNTNEVVTTLEQLQEPDEPCQNLHASSSNGPQNRRRSMNRTSNARTAPLHRPSASR
ncbi:PREDICTED: protein kinase APK1A, chloroplastic-like [Fragaria vesca subsp. vesca]|uniref:probable serine/threonine-protein kinase NAK isoform X1 n=1 Tax=Fragaria vesca subsp. vesca TaxID=101020 RepID=UPI0002C2E2DA|nr:PREDICTED: probable serine/threonine-protein kinase NAK isoform X1 [Fragaria vesca subsp. vesca]